jgi:hypothetical protein
MSSPTVDRCARELLQILSCEPLVLVVVGFYLKPELQTGGMPE